MPSIRRISRCRSLQLRLLGINVKRRQWKASLGTVVFFRNGPLNTEELATLQLSGEGITFTHLTSLEDIAGITGAEESVLASLKAGEGFLASELRFSKGYNSFLAKTDGSIFVTDLELEASEVVLSRIGVFKSSGKQDFAIQFTESEVFFNGTKTSQ